MRRVSVAHVQDVERANKGVGLRGDVWKDEMATGQGIRSGSLVIAVGSKNKRSNKMRIHCLVVAPVPVPVTSLAECIRYTG